MTAFRAVVIGSGAGGAPAAAVLAEAWGDGVALLEAGPHLTAADFTQVERDMVPKLYAGGGLQASEDGAVAVLQAQTVGGSTVVNDAVCFRPPPELEARWRPYGVDVDLAALTPFVDEVERAMGVEDIGREKINRANFLLGLGAARLGYAAHRLRHNSPGCVQCGFRHTGCAYNAKRSMNLAFVPRAVSSGARLLPHTAVTHLERSDGRWLVHTRNPAHETLSADHVVVCAGVMQTPAILLRSGIQAGNGVQVHLHSTVFGEFPDPVDMFSGIPMSMGVTEFADVNGHEGPGYLIEGSGIQPMPMGVQAQAEGTELEEILRRYRHLASCIAVVRSRARGRISLRGGRAALDYPFVDADMSRIAHFFERAVEIYLAAGASRAMLAHRTVRWVQRPTRVDDLSPGRFYCYTAHPFGGANRGAVTDGVGRVVGQPGLWVLDASAFPEAIGLNPQITIASLAMEGATRLLA